LAVQSNSITSHYEHSRCSKLKAILNRQIVLVPRFQPNMLDSLDLIPVLRYSSLRLRRASMPLMSDSQMPQSRLSKQLGSLVSEQRSLSHHRLRSQIGVLQKTSHNQVGLHHKPTVIHCARTLLMQKLQLQVVGLL
jgi:hypothetical protein